MHHLTQLGHNLVCTTSNHQPGYNIPSSKGVWRVLSLRNLAFSAVRQLICFVDNTNNNDDMVVSYYL